MGYVFCAEAVGAVPRPVLLRLRVCVLYICTHTAVGEEEPHVMYVSSCCCMCVCFGAFFCFNIRCNTHLMYPLRHSFEDDVFF